MQDFFKVINNKYNNLLLNIDEEILKSYLELMNIKRKLLTDISYLEDGFFRSELEEKSKPVYELLQEYKNELKKVFIENDGILVHITNIAPENLIDGRLLKSRDKLNNYMTEIGDWVFASSSIVDGNNTYIARKPKEGMISINYTTIVYGGDNFEIIKSKESGENHILLKNPNYIYYLFPQNFEPVCTVLRDRRKNQIRFDFSEEWVCTEDIDITNRTIVKNIETVKDITSLFTWRQIFCDPSIKFEKTPVAYIIRNTLPEKRLDKIAQFVKQGRLKYINGLAGINVNEELVEKIGIENFKKLNK